MNYSIISLLLFPSLVLAQSSVSPPTKALVLIHVTVIDATGSPAMPDMSVVIRNHRISSISRTKTGPPPDDAQVVEAAGKFLIPGLWDMHVHTGQRDIFLPLYIANGITGVRDMGGDLEDPSGDLSARYVQLNLWREAIEQGTLIGPRIVAAGFLIDGFPWRGNVPAANADDGRQAVDALKRIGVDFIKVKSFLSREAYFAIAAEARDRHMVLAGHVPNSVRATEASDAGQKSVEHLTNVALGCSASERQLMADRDKAFAVRVRRGYAQAELRAEETFDDTVANTLFTKFVKNSTWQVPTLVELRENAIGDPGNATDQATKIDPRWSYLPSSLREAWGKEHRASRSEEGQRSFANDLALTERMHKFGVRFMAGTDSANPFILPGFSLHDELRLLVTAGLTPMEALQAATLNPAIYLNRERDLGTVTTGKLADLVLLDASPLDDISNTRKIRAVFVNGRYLSREDLDAMLGRVKDVAK